MKTILFGASGMVGQGVLIECLEDPAVENVLAIGRRPVEQEHRKLQQLIHSDFTDFGNIADQLAGYDACFFCLGVSSIGMGEESYRHITYDFTMAAARVLSERNPNMTFCYVTGIGADPTETSRLMWARVKGKTEKDLAALPFKATYMFRPGYIQPRKGVVSGVWWTKLVYDLIGFGYPLWNQLFGRRLTTSDNLGRAMIRLADNPPPNTPPILHAPEINTLASPAT